tara:strand:+ start:727 stop:1098 length:372 start_codon:yes stop_codon:yes gene_type:complete
MMASPGLIALAIVLVTTIVWFRRAFRVAIPQNPGPFAVAWGIGGGLGLLSLSFAGGAAAAWAAGLGFLFLYFVMTGAQRAGADRIRVGDAIPAFTALDAAGNTFDSSELAGNPVLIKFFRGHW